MKENDVKGEDIEPGNETLQEAPSSPPLEAANNILLEDASIGASPTPSTPRSQVDATLVQSPKPHTPRRHFSFTCSPIFNVQSPSRDNHITRREFTRLVSNMNLYIIIFLLSVFLSCPENTVDISFKLVSILSTPVALQGLSLISSKSTIAV